MKAKVIIIIPILFLALFFLFPKENAFESKRDNDNELKQILDNMSLEEKVGQMFIVRTPQYDATNIATKYHFGGYVLFTKDFKNKTKKEVKDSIASYKNSGKIPMLIAVDEEGGPVVRISKFKEFRDEPFKSMQEIYQEYGLTGLKNDTIDKAKFLKDLGINVNLAPVADISTNPDDYIYKRTLGANAKETSAYIKTVVSAMKDEKIASTLKHFPGYGSNLDTHKSFSVDNRSYEEIKNNDLIPFDVGIKSGADMVMVSHNIITSIDNENPASLSPKVHEILRNDLNFSGVIITDDLDMGAIKAFASNTSVAVLAILAGNDLICITDFEKEISDVIAAVKSGKIKEERINESVLRILKMKRNLD